MSPQPNIIICMCDQLRAHALGCYGDPVIRTPHIDQLAADGLRFEHAISSRPVCMAARSSVLSGQYPRRCAAGVGNVSYKGRPGSFELPEYPDAGRPHLPDPTLPELLRAAGYHNEAIGKWHIHTWPHDIAFDHYLIPRVHHVHSAQLFTDNGGPEFAAPGYSVDFEVERVGAFFQQRAQSEQPFFLYYNISPPHCPVSDGPERYTRMYDPADIPIRPNVDLATPLKDQDYWFKVYRWDVRYYSYHLPYTEQLPTDYDLRRLIAEYYGMTTWVDDTVGRMLASLDDAGLADNTIVIFTSDHGDNLGSHGRVQKGSTNEESIRVPLIVRMPDALVSGPGARGVNTTQVGCLVDLMPTLLDLADIDVPDHVHGASLADVLRGARRETDRPHAFVETGGEIAVRTPEHVYALRCNPDRTLADDTHFFTDLVADPYQLHNLAGTRQHGDVAATLDGLLRAWHATTPYMDAPDA